MGFYAPAQLVRDAEEHDVEVRSIDVNASHWDNGLERREDGTLAMRLGYRQIGGFREEWGWAIARTCLEDGPFVSIEDLARRAELPRACAPPPCGCRRLPFIGAGPAAGTLGGPPHADR